MQNEQAAVTQQRGQHLVGKMPGEDGVLAPGVPLERHGARFDQESPGPPAAAHQEHSRGGIPRCPAGLRRAQPPWHQALTHDDIPASDIDARRNGAAVGRSQRRACERHSDR